MQGIPVLWILQIPLIVHPSQHPCSTAGRRASPDHRPVRAAPDRQDHYRAAGAGGDPLWRRLNVDNLVSCSPRLPLDAIRATFLLLQREPRDYESRQNRLRIAPKCAGIAPESPTNRLRIAYGSPTDRLRIAYESPTARLRIAHGSPTDRLRIAYRPLFSVQ